MPLALQILYFLLGHRLPIVALLQSLFVEVLLRELLQIGRQSFSGDIAEGNMDAGPNMAGQTAIFLDLVKLGGVDQHQRILLAVDDPRLQRTVHLGKIDRGRRRAEALEQRNKIRRHRQADLEPFKSSGVSIGLVRVVISRKPWS